MLRYGGDLAKPFWDLQKASDKNILATIPERDSCLPYLLLPNTPIFDDFLTSQEQPFMYYIPWYY